MYPHVMGQPFRIRALREFIEYAAAHKDVWFASREAIASWYLQNHQSHTPPLHNRLQPGFRRKN